MCYRTNVWYRLTHHLLGHENSSKYLRMYYLKYHCRNWPLVFEVGESLSAAAHNLI